MRDEVDDLIVAGRVLDEHHARLRLSQTELLGAAEAAFELAEGADRGLFVDADHMSGGCGSRGVIDVVAARQVDMNLVGVAENVEHDVRGVRAGGDDLRYRDLGRDTVIAALRTAEAAEMAVGAVVVLVLGLAVDAVHGVRKLVRGFLINRHVDAEADDGVRNVVLRERGGQ